MTKNLGNSDLVSISPWPEIFDSLLIDDTVEIAVQINGKVRTKINLPTNLPRKEIEATALSLEEVKKYMDGKEVKRIIHKYKDELYNESTRKLKFKRVKKIQNLLDKKLKSFQTDYCHPLVYQKSLLALPQN